VDGPHSVGLVAGLALALPLGVPIFAVVGAMAGTPIVLGIVGVSLGTAQWPIIRRHPSPSRPHFRFATIHSPCLSLQCGNMSDHHLMRFSQEC